MLIENTVYLREHFPEIRKYFLEHERNLHSGKVEVLESKSGLPTMRYEYKGKQLMLHSMYNPEREAEKIIASHKENFKPETHVFFYGVGMGYHIEKFKEKYPDLSYSIYEPLPEIFWAMSQKRLIENFITENTNGLYVDRHDIDTNNYFEEFQTENKQISIIVLPSYENIIKEKINLFFNQSRKVVERRRTNLHANVNFQKLWVINSIMNFKEVVSTPNIMRDINFSQFENKPVMIVSAGPSLHEDIEWIRHIKENNLAYLFAVGSAINGMIANNVLPDAVLTYDPTPYNETVFEKMNEHQIDTIPIIFGSSVSNESLMDLKGPKLHFLTTQDRTSLYYFKDQLNIEKDLILDSPSIAVMAFQIVNKIGMNPVIFAGQNLGYLNGQLYSKEIKYDHITEDRVKKDIENSKQTMDVYGNIIQTNDGFNSMRESIENFAQEFKNQTFINTTKGGANIQGVPFQPIEHVIKNVLTKPIEKKSWWLVKNSYDQSRIIKAQKLLENDMKDFKQVHKQFSVLLNHISDLVKLKNKAGLEKAFIKFDRLYQQLADNIYYQNFLSFYIRVQVELMASKLKGLNQENDIFKKGRGAVEVFTSFLERCEEGNRELEGFITQCLS